MIIVTLSVIHFLLKLIKISYGRISLRYNYNSENIINWKKKLCFKINHNIKKEFITLQLEDILTPKKIETEDSKITNISILSIAKSKMQIKEEFIIEALQNFEQYNKINSISVRIIDPDIQNKLLFYSKINIDLLLTVFCLVLQLKKTQRLFLLQQMA